MLNQIFSILKISALALVLSIGLSYAFAAWAPPQQLPPGGNVDAPINVGATPQTKVGGLTVGSLVTGTLRVTTGAGAARVLTSDASGNATWQAPTGGSALPSGVAGQTLRNIGGTSWATSSTIFNDGTNVGIGTTAPTGKLDVNGNIRQTVTHGNNMGLVMPAANNSGGTGQVGLYSWISEPSATWTGGGIARNMINSNASFPRINTGLSGQMMHFTEAGNIEFTTENTGGWRTTPLAVTNAGNVGIGNTAPAYKLDVSGNVRSTGSITSGGFNTTGLVQAGTLYDNSIAAYTTEVPVAGVDTNGNWAWTRVVTSVCSTCGSTRGGGVALSSTLPVLGIRISGPTGSACTAYIYGSFNGGIASSRTRFTDLDIDGYFSANSYSYGNMGDSTFIFDRVLSGRDLGSQDQAPLPAVLKTAYNKAAGLTHIRPGQWLSYYQWSNGTQSNTCYIDVLYGNYR